MSRFLGILLMLATGSVLVELIAAAPWEPTATGVVLGISFVVLGLLLGVLATARQWLWAILGSATAILPQFLESRARTDLPPGGEARSLLLLVVPPIALILGTLVGARLLERRYQARIKPEHDD